MRRHSDHDRNQALEKYRLLASAGKNQSEICAELGITVMTLHRWRKEHHLQPAAMTQLAPAHPLEIENARLRTIVINLALDIEVLKEALRRQHPRVFEG